LITNRAFGGNIRSRIVVSESVADLFAVHTSVGRSATGNSGFKLELAFGDSFSWGKLDTGFLVVDVLEVVELEK